MRKQCQPKWDQPGTQCAFRHSRFDTLISLDTNRHWEKSIQSPASRGSSVNNVVIGLWVGQLVNLDSIPGRGRYFSLLCNVHTRSRTQLASYPMVTIGSFPGSKVAAVMALTTDQECSELHNHSCLVFMAWCLSKPSLLTNLLQVCPWKVCNYSAGQETPLS
jgi:hypothetical protein